ncbi:MAG: hypothetical protein ACK5JI_08710 [Azonexus sp.]
MIDVGFLKVAAGVAESGAVWPGSQLAGQIPADEGAVGVDAQFQAEAAAVFTAFFEQGFGDA